jgi:hypothetical protein
METELGANLYPIIGQSIHKWTVNKFSYMELLFVTIDFLDVMEGSGENIELLCSQAPSCTATWTRVTLLLFSVSASLCIKQSH